MRRFCSNNRSHCFHRLGLQCFACSALFPILWSTELQSATKHFNASFETSVNPSFSKTSVSPLEGASAMLLNELTREIQQRVPACIFCLCKNLRHQINSCILRKPFHQAKFGSLVVHIQEAHPVTQVTQPQCIRENCTQCFSFENNLFLARFTQNFSLIFWKLTRKEQFDSRSCIHKGTT